MARMYEFKFVRNGREIQRVECDFTEARKVGNEIAEEAGDVQMMVYNDPLRQWEPMGTYHGDMKVTNFMGVECVIRPDFSGVEIVGSKGGAS